MHMYHMNICKEYNIPYQLALMKSNLDWQACVRIVLMGSDTCSVSQARTNIPMQKSNTLRTTCGMVDISHRIAPLSIALHGVAPSSIA